MDNKEKNFYFASLIIFLSGLVIYLLKLKSRGLNYLAFAAMTISGCILLEFIIRYLKQIFIADKDEKNAKNKETKEKFKNKSDEYGFCPICGMIIFNDELKCSYCGYETKCKENECKNKRDGK